MEKKFYVGDRVAGLDHIKKRAAGMSPNPLFRCSEVTAVVERDNGYTYRVDGGSFEQKEKHLVHEEDIRRVALEFLMDKMMDVINAAQGGD